jgi:uncharacterized protein (DUF1697 family)
MPRYVAWLRGVSPMNAKMPELKAAFEAAGFTGVKTVLSSGNVVFDARKAKDATLERKCEAAMEAALGKSFVTIVRSVEHLQALLQADPFARFQLAANEKRVVSFLKHPQPAALELPIEFKGARILAMAGGEVFAAYLPQANNPAFMKLIENTFRKEVTTRTWETVQKCAAA